MSKKLSVMQNSDICNKSKKEQNRQMKVNEKRLVKKQKNTEEHFCCLGCKLILDDDKTEIFKAFSKLDKQSKITFLNSMIKASVWEKNVSCIKIYRKFFLPINNKKIRVCKVTFIQTLQLDDNDLIMTKQKQLQTSTLRISKKIEKDSLKQICDTGTRTKKKNHGNLSIAPRVALFDVYNSKTDKSSICVTKPQSYQNSKKLTFINTSANLSPLKIHSWTQTNFPQIKSFAEISIQTESESVKELIDSSIDFPMNTISFTINNVKSNPKLFVGVSNLFWIDDVCNFVKSSIKDVLLILQKIRLNCSPKELAFYYEHTVEEVFIILNYYTPLIAHALKDFLDWQNSKVILDVMPSNLLCKYGCIRSILKLVRVITRELILKFVMSITPLGMISFVSEVFVEKENNISILCKSKFFEEVPKNCGIVIESDLSDIKDLLAEKGYTVFLNKNFEDDANLIFSNENLFKEEITQISKIAEITYANFKQFNILNCYDPCEFNYMGSLYHVAMIIAELVNLQLLNDKSLTLNSTNSA